MLLPCPALPSWLKQTPFTATCPKDKTFRYYFITYSLITHCWYHIYLYPCLAISKVPDSNPTLKYYMHLFGSKSHWLQQDWHMSRYANACAVDISFGHCFSAESRRPSRKIGHLTQVQTWKRSTGQKSGWQGRSWIIGNRDRQSRNKWPFNRSHHNGESAPNIQKPELHCFLDYLCL